MTDPGVLPLSPSVSPIKRISPSRYFALRECELREIWAANRVAHSLPTLANARLGTIIHRLLEAAAKGEFQGTSAEIVSERFEQAVNIVEEQMRGIWFESQLVPLRDAIPKYEVQRLRVLRRLVKFSSSPRYAPRISSSTVAVGCELWVQLENGEVGGYIDRVVEEHGYLVIQDYKTGLIFQEMEGSDEVRVKPEYMCQLQMYAALYYATFGVWANELRVVPTQGAEISIPVVPDDCLRLVTEASVQLEETNRKVAMAKENPGYVEMLARPSAVTCRNCVYRPSCGEYQRARANTEEDGWPNDVCGSLKDLQVLPNGRLNITMATSGGTQFIRSLTPGQRHPALLSIRAGDELYCFNLRRGLSGAQYEENRYTTIYRL